MQYNFFGESIEFTLHEQKELFSDLIRAYGCSTDMEDILAYKQFIKPNDIVIDVGANIGWNCSFIAKFLHNTGQVYAFEPNAKNFDLLKKNIQDNNFTNVTPIQCALSNHKETMKLYKSITNFGNHILNPVYVNEEEHLNYDEVEVNTFDSFLEEYNIDKKSISMIKLDIQGHEPNFFKGAEQFFKDHRPKLIMEYAPSHISQVGGSPFEIAAFVDIYKYNTYVIEPVNLAEPVFKLKQFSVLELMNKTESYYKQMKHLDICMIHGE